MKASYALAALFTLSLVSAANAAEKKADTKPAKVIEFSEDEVPHFQVVKKDGKLTAEIIDTTTTQISQK
jgi:hypothetical protein